jgi:hypothetical protein
MPNEQAFGGPTEVALLMPEVASGRETLPAARCLQIHSTGVKTRGMHAEPH